MLKSQCLKVDEVYIRHYQRLSQRTWFNLLACARKRDCPACRDKLALDDFICVGEK
jgi:hypothetical protein